VPNVVAVSAGGLHSLILSANGNVYAFGSSSVGQLGLGTLSTQIVPTLIPNLHNVIQISAGFQNSFVINACNQTYGGSTCQLSVCSGFLASSALTCSGTGRCNAPDQCTCNPPSSGDHCQIQTFRWTGAFNTLWSQALSWQINGLDGITPPVASPGADATIYIDSPGTYTVTVDVPISNIVTMTIGGSTSFPTVVFQKPTSVVGSLYCGVNCNLVVSSSLTVGNLTVDGTLTILNGGLINTPILIVNTLIIPTGGSVKTGALNVGGSMSVLNGGSVTSNVMSLGGLLTISTGGSVIITDTIVSNSGITLSGVFQANTLTMNSDFNALVGSSVTIQSLGCSSTCKINNHAKNFLFGFLDLNGILTHFGDTSGSNFGSNSVLNAVSNPSTMNVNGILNFQSLSQTFIGNTNIKVNSQAMSCTGSVQGNSNSVITNYGQVACVNGMLLTGFVNYNSITVSGSSSSSLPSRFVAMSNSRFVLNASTLVDPDGPFNIGGGDFVASGTIVTPTFTFDSDGSMTFGNPNSLTVVGSMVISANSTVNMALNGLDISRCDSFNVTGNASINGILLLKL
jgi:hypothetical protein